MVLAQKQTWNRIEDPDMKSHNYNQLVFDKGAKNIRWRNSSLFNKNCWENWLAVYKKLKLDPCISPYTNIDSKWIKDLNIRPQTLKLVQKRVGNTLELIGIGLFTILVDLVGPVCDTAGPFKPFTELVVH
jgi:hypothetical protein